MFRYIIHRKVLNPHHYDHRNPLHHHTLYCCSHTPHFHIKILDILYLIKIIKLIMYFAFKLLTANITNTMTCYTCINQPLFV